MAAVLLRVTESGRNARNVWTIPTQGRRDAHFATFPDELPRRCILAGTSEKGVVRQPVGAEVKSSSTPNGAGLSSAERLSERKGRVFERSVDQITQTLGWRPTCDHDATTVPATILDPFVGSGTTLAVAQSLGRHSIGTDLNHEYLEIAKKRIGKVSLPMF